MKKLVYTLIALMVLVVFMAGCTTVVPETDLSRKGPNGQAGNSNIAHLYLYEKIPQATDFVGDWPLVDDGAWGKMKYNLSGEEFDFVFNGHGLVPGEEYCLIYFEDPDANPWTSLPNIYCLSMGTANGGGNVHIADSVDTQMDFPTNNDKNYPEGGKIWLVLSDNCSGEGWGTWQDGWNPTEYLFEGDLITFDDTDV